MPRVMGKTFASLPDPQSLGLPPHPQTLFEKRIVSNDHIYERLQQKKVVAKPGVEALSGGDVVFTDGSKEAVDIIIAATRLPLQSAILKR